MEHDVQLQSREENKGVERNNHRQRPYQPHGETFARHSVLYASQEGIRATQDWGDLPLRPARCGSLELGRRLGPTVMEALSVLDAQLLHHVVLGLALDALGDEPCAERGAETDDRVQERLTL